MIDLRIGQVSDNVANLFSEHLAGISYEDKKWLLFSYDEKNGVLTLSRNEKPIAEVKVKIFTFLVQGITNRINTVSPGAYYTNLYLQYGLEDEVKEYRAYIIKKLLSLELKKILFFEYQCLSYWHNYCKASLANILLACNNRTKLIYAASLPWHDFCPC